MKIKLFLFFLLALLYSSTYSQSTEFWGMTSRGGTHDAGIIFKTDSCGENQNVVYSFKKIKGISPKYTNLIEASNGKLYGMTTEGEFPDFPEPGVGVIFEYNPLNAEYKILYQFKETNGKYPQASLIQGSNGKLYGMTREGGANGYGVLFEYDLDLGLYNKLFDFDDTNGSYPNGTLFQASNNKLYGMTSEGGLNSLGVLFEYDITNDIFSKNIDFDGTNNGSLPNASLIEISNKLYGMTTNGGVNDLGTIFSYDISNNNLTSLFSFNGTTNGKLPFGDLLQFSGDTLFALTSEGGSNNWGVLFKYIISTNSFEKMLDFDNALNTGRYPYGSLIKASNNKLYGLNKMGGSSNYGIVFEYDVSTSSFSKKHSFSGNNDGKNPCGGLVQCTNGNLYGLTYEGGENNAGILFSYDFVNDTYTYLLSFNFSENGSYPCGGLSKDENGMLYGETSTGGSHDFGVLFMFNPITNTYTKKIDFIGTNGKHPIEDLTYADNGKFYGLTYNGGVDDDGIIFEYDPITNILTRKFSFNDDLGISPNGSLVQISNGELYGTTNYGGENISGTLFKYDINSNVYTKLYDFVFGSSPNSNIVEFVNGNIYGTNSRGGSNGKGVIFEYNSILDTLIAVYEFIDDGGPCGNLVVFDNKLYGMTSSFGGNQVGAIFEFNPFTGIYANKYDFDTINGSEPYGSLTLASNGKLYAMTNKGGVNNMGVLFEFNPSTDVYTKKIDFDGSNGKNPERTTLLEIEKVEVLVNKLSKNKQIAYYPNPTNGIINIDKKESNLLKVELVNNTGKIILSKNTYSQITKLDIKSFTSGIYFIKFYSDDDMFVEKIVKY